MSSINSHMYTLQTYLFNQMQAAEDDQRQHSEDMSKMEQSLIMKDEIIRYNAEASVKK